MSHKQLHDSWHEITKSMDQKQFSDKDYFWTNKKSPNKPVSRLGFFIRFIIIFTALVIVLFILTSGASYKEKIAYLIENSNQNTEAITNLSTTTPGQTIDLYALKHSVEISTLFSSLSTETKSQLTNLSNNDLFIPKINKIVPIIWNSGTDENALLINLEQGLVHYTGTSLPSEGSGPVFIVGHSSYYWWNKGLYKTVFANLDKLETNDEIFLAYQDIVYIYRVTDKVIVKPDQTEVMNQKSGGSLALMTCWPTGTSLKRLVVFATEISPSLTLDEAKNSNLKEPTPLPTSLAPVDSFNLSNW